MRLIDQVGHGTSLLKNALCIGLTLGGLLAGMAGITASAAEEDGLMMLSIAPIARHGGTERVVRAKVSINAPPALVWNILTRYGEMKHVLPGYEKSTVIRTEGSSTWLDISMRVAAFLPTYRYQVHAQENEAHHQLELSRVSGDFKSLSAVYQLFPQSNGSRTLLVYSLRIDPGFNPPGSQGLIRNHTEKSLKALERQAEQTARKSLIGQR